MDVVKQRALLGCATGLMRLSGEWLVRSLIPAWPVEPALDRPAYVTARDLPRRWRSSSTEGRHRLGLKKRAGGPKPPGTMRLLLLGDSLIGSGDTRSGALDTEVLERRLNARALHSPRAFEVIHAGIPGYTTSQGDPFRFGEGDPLASYRS